MKLLCILLIAAVTVSPAAGTNTDNMIGEMYSLFYESAGYKYSLYEPEDACYIGADIVTGERIPMEIKEFEKIMGKSHGIYVNSMRADEPFPLKWVLGCISEMRTPCIILEPLSKNIRDMEKYLEKLADSFGEYYVPMFVQLMPVSRSYNIEDYIEIFRKAHDIFKERASNVALVFTINGYDALDLVSYYPGNDYVDWVGLNIFNTIERDKEYSYDAIKALDLFYYHFQKEKPIMISQLAVSHFSNIDHMYRVTQAISEIDRIYQAVAEKYPRIKCVIYKNFNGVGLNGYGDNFSVTDNQEITNAYKKNISDLRFTSDIDLTSMNELRTEPMQAAFPAYKIGSNYYISENTLLYELKLVGLSSYGEVRLIDGVRYYNADILRNTSKKYQISGKKKCLTVTR